MEMLRSRKGVTALFTALVAVVIVVVVLILLIFLIDKISDASEEEALRSRCKTSLLAYSRIKNLPFGDTNADEADIDCPTRYLTIPEGNQNDMRRSVANQLVNCWSDFGEGKIKLFSAEDTKFCVICSVFQFEDRSVRLTGLPSFMMTERAPVFVNKKRPTYQEYLTGMRTNEEVVDRARNSMDPNFFDGSKRYAVMFTFYKQSYWSRLQSAGFWGGVMAVAGLVVGIGVSVVTGGAAAPVSAMIIGATIGGAAGAAGGAASGGEGRGGGWTTSGADWDANVVVSEYVPDQIREFGCKSLPISQVDERFK
jgi:hypothetical protein